jgi:gluconate kinase
MTAKPPGIILIMGVSRSGKTTVARLLAHRQGGVFFDADDFHPPANIDKMSRGIPLECLSGNAGHYMDGIRSAFFLEV